MNSELSVSDWQSMCRTQHTSTSSKEWREFGWKNLIRFFITPHIKTKQLGKTAILLETMRTSECQSPTFGHV